MPRYDKYEPFAGGFRAPLAVDFDGGENGANFGKLYSASLNNSGQVVIDGSGGPDKGVLILTSKKYAGDIVDVMTAGEIVEFELVDGTAAAAGVDVYSTGDGSYGTAAGAAASGGNYIGFTVEPSRLVVRFGRGAAA